MSAAERVMSLIDQGGWVMYPLLLLSVASVAVTLERSFFWMSRAARLDPAWFDRTLDALRAADWSSVTRDAAGARNVHAGYAARLAAEAQRLDPSANIGLTSAAIAAAERFRPSIERFASVHATIITAAPMLGILGTVSGIIQSFQLIGDEAVVSDPAVIASGIAEALFTTALGLIVALITLFPHAIFRAASERCIVAFRDRRRVGRGGAGGPANGRRR
jgi:biopolymer transport protein ExbB